MNLDTVFPLYAAEAIIVRAGVATAVGAAWVRRVWRRERPTRRDGKTLPPTHPRKDIEP